MRQRNECISLIQESIENDRIKDIIKAPLFTSDGITQMRCNLTKGFTQFEVSGVDTEGEDFSIFQTSGGMAASGADSVYNYCYLKNNQQVSGIRITGRQSATSTPTCF